MKNWFNILRQSIKPSSKVWISKNEIHKFTRMVIWATGIGDWKKEFETLERRILKLYTNNGPQFTFQYLKEVVRYTIKYLSGEFAEGYLKSTSTVVSEERYKETIKSTSLFWRRPLSLIISSSRLYCNYADGKIPKGSPPLVALSGGIPLIIPFKLREVLRKRALSENRALYIGILSLLCIYRVFPTKVKPDLGSIITPFSGISKILEVNKIRESLREITDKVNPRFFNLRLIGGESSGPTSSKAVWGSDSDAWAFIHNPKQFWSILYLFVHYRKWGFMLWFLLLSVVFSPYYLITLSLGRWPIQLGRLSVVYDQAGKARVVAITNWWIQLVLKPLHDNIFSILRTIPQDGTFDQKAPLFKLIKEYSGQKFYSFDLSSATDRLPIDVQVQVLQEFTNPYYARTWRNLLDFGWLYGFKTVKYEVGQPMGAYSSWAMLALTHHVLVRYSARLVGIHNFQGYALLGDDIVIANDKVASSYLDVMKTLGVKINLSKSVQSFDFAEFAKVWVGPKCDISPIGAGVLLQASRNRYYVTRLILDLLDRKILRVPGWSLLKTYIETAPEFIRKGIYKVYWALFLTALVSQENPNKSSVFLNEFIGLDFSRFPDRNGKRWSVESVFELIEERLKKDKRRLRESMKFLLLNAIRITQTRGQFFYPGDLLFVLFKPGFWYYFLSGLRSLNEITDRHIWIASNRMALDKYRLSCQRQPFTLEYLLSLADIVNVKSINWLEQERIRDQNSLISKLSNNYSLRETLYCDPVFTRSIVMPLRLDVEKSYPPLQSPASNWPSYVGVW